MGWCASGQGLTIHMSACLRSQPKSADVTGVAPRIASSLTLRDRERCLRGPSNSVHDAKFMITIATQNPALICAFSELPIGIEPMTYTLRGGLRSSTAVHHRHLGLGCALVPGRCFHHIQARPGSLLALALARSCRRPSADRENQLPIAGMV